MSTKLEDSVSVKFSSIKDLYKHQPNQISDIGIQKIVEICENHVLGQTRAVQEIVTICSKLTGYEFYCNQIVSFCNQIFSDTLNTSHTIINLCKSFKISAVDLRDSETRNQTIDTREDNPTDKKTLTVPAPEASLNTSETAPCRPTSSKCTTSEIITENNPCFSSLTPNFKTVVSPEEKYEGTDDSTSATNLAFNSNQHERKKSRKSKPVKIQPKHESSNNKVTDEDTTIDDENDEDTTIDEENDEDTTIDDENDEVEDTAEFEDLDFDVEDICEETENLESEDPDWNTMQTKTVKKRPQKTSDSMYTCSFCGKKYKTKSSFKQHERSHTSDLEKDHIDDEHDEKLDKTYFEDTEHTDEDSALETENVKSNDKDGNLMPTNSVTKHPQKPSEGIYMFTCFLCDKKYKTRSSFKRHERSHRPAHWEEVRTPKKKVTPEDLKCEYCGRYTTTKKGLREHIRTHTGEKPYICEVCGSSFAQSGSLKSHQLIHMEGRPVACELCDYTCLSNRRLKLHMVSHSNEKKFQCAECGNRYARIASLHAHMNVHSGIKAHACDQCNKRFVRRTHMLQHRKIHNEEMQYSCEICGKRSRQAYNITVHMRTHTGHKPFACEICGKKFAHNVSLRQHKNNCTVGDVTAQ